MNLLGWRAGWTYHPCHLKIANAKLPMCMHVHAKRLKISLRYSLGQQMGKHLNESWGRNHSESTEPRLCKNGVFGSAISQPGFQLQDLVSETDLSTQGRRLLILPWCYY